MSTLPATVEPLDLDDPALCEADSAAVLAGLVARTPLDPAVVERVRIRSERLTEHIRRVHGVIDDDTFQSLLADEA